MSESLITMEDDGGAVALPPEYAASAEPETVEEPEPQPEVEADPAQPVTEPAAEPAEEDLQPTADDTPAMRGLKAALVRTRQQAKGYREQAEAVHTLREAISRHPQGQDIIQALRTGQPLTAAQQRVVEAAVQPAVTPQPAQRSAQEERDLAQLAESLSLYDVNGRPDVEAASRVAGFTRAEAQRAAREAANEVVKPFQQERVTTAAAQMKREALDAAGKFGMPQEFVEPIIDQLVGQHPELASDPNNMSTAILVARGLYAIQQDQQRAAQPAVPAVSVQQPVSPPVYREGGTGKPASPSMSNLERTIARQVGAKDNDWQEIVGKLSSITDSTKLITMETD